jgi:hypothetical protein
MVCLCLCVRFKQAKLNNQEFIKNSYKMELVFKNEVIIFQRYIIFTTSQEAVIIFMYYMAVI